MNDFPDLRSKLPNVGTTIFATMSAMAAEYNAINLSQGYPDFPVDQGLLDAVAQALHDGENQYAPMPGLPALREALSAKYKHDYGIEVDPDGEITITAGATQAIFNAITAFVREGEEVILFTPAYDCYAPTVELAGGVPKYIALKAPEFAIDWDEVRAQVSHKTRMIVINNPHNPTGTTWSEADMGELKKLVERYNLIVLSDEVYEHIVFDGEPHRSVLADPELRARSIAVFSFGKTFHATGWKVGYSIAPQALNKEIRKVHQYVTFTVHRPTQVGLAHWLQDPTHWTGISAYYEAKRDLFLKELESSKFSFLPSSGSYYQAVDYSAISDLDDVTFCEWLTKEVGVAAIPVSVFYHTQPAGQQVVRLCFAKKDETLMEALNKLKAL
ncbi:aminotransferase class I/II-fold pyridoxal phosphate-dependent enzyme [Cryomorphaceae bacterium]|nr:aminotransferase class I/II-fold pyridoxal phosphate-dependent enzyme [Cryomorphaceae bacterium]